MDTSTTAIAQIVPLLIIVVSIAAIVSWALSGATVGVLVGVVVTTIMGLQFMTAANSAIPPMLSNPYVGGTTYKGNFHLHTNLSDGTQAPADVVARYVALGYDIISLTDHRLLDGDTMTPDPGVPGILWTGGSEDAHVALDTELIGIGITHVLTYTNPGVNVPFNTGMAEIHSMGGFGFIPHPSKTGSVVPDADIDAAHMDGIEVVNGKAGIAEAKWDRALSTRAARGNTIWGLGNDDSHTPSDDGKAYNMIFAPSLSVANILASLKAGNFYATQGPTIALTVSGSKITVTTSSAATIQWKVTGGAVAQTDANVTTSRYIAQGTDIYVRAVVTRNSDSKKAWSQPLFIVR